jgi:tetratricopeptide (TPR) repeat protein
MKREMFAIGVILAAAVSMGQAGGRGAGAAPGSAGGASDAQPIAVLLEQGIYQEETAGNLEAAAKTYHQIAAQAAVTRGLAAQALVRLVGVQVKQKQMAEAGKTLEQLRTEYPEQKDLIAKAEGLVPGLPAVVTTGPDKRPVTEEDKKQALGLIAEGQQLMQDHKFDQAARIYLQAVLLDPTSVPALDGWGWAILNSGGSPEGAFQRALALDPRDAAALNGLGWFCGNNNNNDEASGYWRRAVEADPTATSAMLGLAKIAAGKGRYDEAVAWYEKWLKVDPQNADANIGMNTAKQMQATMKDARAAIDEFLKRLDDGNYVQSWEMADTRFAASTGGDALKWEDYMKAQRAPMGKLVGRKVDASGVSAFAPGAGRGGGGGGGRGGRGGFAASGFGGSQFGGGRGGDGGIAGTEEVTEVEVQFITQFEHKKDVLENIAAVKTDNGDWRIARYQISTPRTSIDPLKAR